MKLPNGLSYKTKLFKRGDIGFKKLYAVEKIKDPIISSILGEYNFIFINDDGEFISTFSDDFKYELHDDE